MKNLQYWMLGLCLGVSISFIPLGAYNVGVCVTATYKYSKFINPFLDSCRKHFLKGHNITYFVFTDHNIIPDSDTVIVYQAHKPWPEITLKRFENYYNAQSLLSKMDYIFASDVDMLFVNDVDESILGERVSTRHPYFLDENRQKYTYEDNPISAAYIDPRQGKYYFAGGFYGGSYKEFIKMVKILTDNINKDLQHNFIAVWHDESHLNRYFVDYLPTVILPASYCYPEGQQYPFNPILIALEKNKVELRDEK
ncbi:hypothetical protein H0X48_00970 [Candidatus Dependentiae bacterium]|nr:hypothetical protein [Candidatus Dependentiae bacterium]